MRYTIIPLVFIALLFSLQGCQSTPVPMPFVIFDIDNTNGFVAVKRILLEQNPSMTQYYSDCSIEAGTTATVEARLPESGTYDIIILSGHDVLSGYNAKWITKNLLTGETYSITVSYGDESIGLSGNSSLEGEKRSSGYYW